MTHTDFCSWGTFRSQYNLFMKSVVLWSVCHSTHKRNKPVWNVFCYGVGEIMVSCSFLCLCSFFLFFFFPVLYVPTAGSSWSCYSATCCRNGCNLWEVCSEDYEVSSGMICEVLLVCQKLYILYASFPCLLLFRTHLLLQRMWLRREFPTYDY